MKRSLAKRAGFATLLLVLSPLAFAAAIGIAVTLTAGLIAKVVIELLTEG